MEIVTEPKREPMTDEEAKALKEKIELAIFGCKSVEEINWELSCGDYDLQTKAMEPFYRYRRYLCEKDDHADRLKALIPEEYHHKFIEIFTDLENYECDMRESEAFLALAAFKIIMDPSSAAEFEKLADSLD